MMQVTGHQDEWKILLIAGSSGVGKTVIAQGLARQLSIPLLLVDDVRLALQQVTTHVQQPGLHIFLNYQAEQWRRAESIRDDWITIGQAMIPPLKVIMAHHIVVPSVGSIIIEGDGILPSLATSQTFTDLRHFSGLEINHEIRAVFIIEPDEEQILRNLQTRGRGFETWGEEEQRAFGHASWLFGQWLLQDAQAHYLPVLAARPYDSLLERILAVI